MVDEDIERRETDTGVQVAKDVVVDGQPQIEAHADIRGVSFDDVLVKNSTERG